MSVNRNSKKNFLEAGEENELNTLNAQEHAVICDKSTEPPFSGEYNTHSANGIYICRRCNHILYRSIDKFDAGCGWPSFDDMPQAAVTSVPDADGRRTEIICAHCEGHLGHVFHGEKHTDKNTRHCVNSLSIRFVSFKKLQHLALENHATFGLGCVAAGCFWGVEHIFCQQPGVLATMVGYCGGTTTNPTYDEVCRGDTGHAEAVAIIFDKTQTSLKQIYQTFCAIEDSHHPDPSKLSTTDQYRRSIFVTSEKEREIAQSCGDHRDKSAVLAFYIESWQYFWPAEDNHQQYIMRNNAPSC